MTLTVVRERVVRGAALLREYRPDWRDRIDVNQLDVGSARRCPVGQTFGLNLLTNYESAASEWRAALVTLGSPPRGRRDWVETAMHAWAVHHGFDSPHNKFAMTFDWPTLNVAWRELLAN